MSWPPKFAVPPLAPAPRVRGPRPGDNVLRAPLDAPRASSKRARRTKPGIDVFVLAAPGRPEAHEQCFRSIEASDIGTHYRPCFNPRGMPKREHWIRTHERAARAKTEFVLVLEDDCLVNAHILHNCATWRWKHEPLFAAGWLYSPGGLYGGKDVWYGKDTKWYGTVGVLYRRSVLPRLIERAVAQMERDGNDVWDCAMSSAILTGGFRLRVHGPPLVEHLYNLPSAIRHEHNYWYGSTRGHFRPHWRRPLAHKDGLPR